MAGPPMGFAGAARRRGVAEGSPRGRRRVPDWESEKGTGSQGTGNKDFAKQRFLHEMGLESRSRGDSTTVLHEISIRVFLVSTNHP